MRFSHIGTTPAPTIHQWESPMKLTKIDKEACKTIQEAATAALQAVAESHGLAVKAAGGRYDGVIFTAKFEFALTSEDGQAISREAEDFKHYCSL